MVNSTYGKGRQVTDDDLKVVDGGDQSKKLRWEISGIASGTTVTMTAPTSDFNFNTPTFASIAVPNITPGANFTLTQNSVVPFTSVESGAIANTLYLKDGMVGIRTIPIKLLDIAGSVNDHLVRITNSHATSGAGMQILAGDSNTESVLRLSDKDSTLLFEVYAAGRTYIKGDLGVGIIVPTENLHIYNTAGHVDVLIESVEAAKSAGMILKTPSREWVIAAWESGGLFRIRDATAGVDRFTINYSGVVNISNLTASSDVQTDASKNLISVSDERFKDIVMESDGVTKKSIQDATIKLLNIEPVYYRFKSDVKAGKNALQLGFSAQNVHSQVSEAAYHDTSDIVDKEGVKIGSNDLYGFNSRSMLAVLVKGFQELEKRVKDMEAA